MPWKLSQRSADSLFLYVALALALFAVGVVEGAGRRRKSELAALFQSPAFKAGHASFIQHRSAAHPEACSLCVSGLAYGETLTHSEKVADKELLQELFTASCDKIKQKLPHETVNVDCDTDVREAVIKPKVSEMVADEDKVSKEAICASWGVPCHATEAELLALRRVTARHTTAAADAVVPEQ